MFYLIRKINITGFVSFTFAVLFTFSLSAQPPLATLEKSVGQIVCIPLFRRGNTGTGFLIHPQGYIVTNHHVIKRCLPYSSNNKLLIRFSLSEVHPLEVIDSDARLDLAILKMPPTPKPILRLYGLFNMAKGSPLWSIGFPGAADLATGNQSRVEATVTNGTVSRLLVQDRLHRKVIQTDTPINPGNSGGPIFNECGHVVGISTYIARFAEGIKFAVSTTELLPMLQRKNIRSHIIQTHCQATVVPLPTPSVYLWLIALFSSLLAFFALVVAFQKRKKQAYTRLALSQKPSSPKSFSIPQAGSLYQRDTHGRVMNRGDKNPVLLGISGEYQGMNIPLDTHGIIVMGRDISVCHLVFSAHNTYISKKHAEMKLEQPEKVWIRDCWSTQGTYVDGKSLIPGEWYEIKLGQVLTLGKGENRFELKHGTK